MSGLPNFPDLLVLVADPSVHMRRIIRDVISRAGIKRVVEATDGAEAIESFSTAFPDIVIVDWDMPMLTGEEFVRLVRTPATSPSPRASIILTTSAPQKSIISRAVTLGVNEVLMKPFSPKALWGRMDQVVRYPRQFEQVGSMLKPVARVIAGQAA
ncbi:MAG: response regulator [Bosea sp. (in: a-proteobacteria)]